MKHLTTRGSGALRVALAASIVTVLVLTSAVASARNHRERGPVMKFIGYQVLVEPEVTEPQRDRLVTRRLVWKFRAVFENPRTGQRVHVMTNIRGMEDSYVRVRRPWRPRHKFRTSRLFEKERRATRFFRDIRESDDILAIEGTRDATGPARPVQPAQPAQPAAPPPPTCKEVLLQKNHSAIHLDKCRGVDRACAVAVLRAGHSPIHLSKCRTKGLTPACVTTLLRAKHSPIHLDKCKNVDAHCAVSLLNAKHSPIHLDKCRGGGLSRRCVTALFDKRHSPIHLSKCRGVDGKCAAMLLGKGQSPIHLGKCR